MIRPGFLRRYPGLFTFGLGLFAFLLFQSWLLLVHHEGYQLRLEEAHAHDKLHELALLMGDSLDETGAGEGIDEALIGRMVDDLAARDSNIVRLRALVGDRELAGYRRPGEHRRVIEAAEPVALAGRERLRLEMGYSLDGAERLMRHSHLRLNLLSLGGALLVALLLWWLLRLTAVRPLEREIEARRQVERELRDSEEWSRLLLDSTGEGIYAVDLEGNCTVCNPAAARLLGYEAPERLLGRDMHGLIHGHRGDGTPYPLEACPVHGAIHDGRPFAGSDEWFERADGSRFPVEFTAYPLRRHGKVVGSVVTFFDITERLRAEAELREREARFRGLFDNSADGIILADPESSRFLLANAAAGRMLGYAPEELVGMEVADFHRPEDLAGVLARFHEMGGQEFGLVHELPMLRRDGSLFHADIHSFITPYEGRPCLCGSFRDVSERRRLIQEQERLNRELERRVAESVAEMRAQEQLLFHQARYAQMGEMLSMIAHQWRQPLTALSTAGIALAVNHSLGKLQGEEVTRFIDYLERQTQAMSATIDDFMEFFRPDQEAELFTLPLVVEEVRQLIGAQLRNRGIELLDRVPARPPLSGHRKALEQVLINLIANARDAYEGHPPEDAGRAPRSIDLHAEPVAGAMRITVEDHAGGIPAEVLERIFDPYFSTKEQGKGTGIGLYMSRNLIERDFGGSLRVENGADGARFTIELPLEARTNG